MTKFGRLVCSTDPGDVFVIVGENNRRFNEGTERTHRVREIIQHELYSRFNLHNDIGKPQSCFFFLYTCKHTFIINIRALFQLFSD